MFPDDRVAAAVADRFVALKQLLGENREASRRYRPFWTPTLYFLDPDGHALVTWPGPIGADDVLPLLDFGEAQVGIRRGRFKPSLALLEGIGDAWPDSPLAPEALWWAASLQYVMEGDRDALESRRGALVERYPDSAAARRV